MVICKRLNIYCCWQNTLLSASLKYNTRMSYNTLSTTAMELALLQLNTEWIKPHILYIVSPVQAGTTQGELTVQPSVGRLGALVTGQQGTQSLSMPCSYLSCSWFIGAHLAIQALSGFGMPAQLIGPSVVATALYTFVGFFFFFWGGRLAWVVAMPSRLAGTLAECPIQAEWEQTRAGKKAEPDVGGGPGLRRVVKDPENQRWGSWKQELRVSGSRHLYYRKPANILGCHPEEEKGAMYPIPQHQGEEASH